MYRKFKSLHQQNSPLLLGNVWDVQSSQTLESIGFKALGTSSAAMANMLGYEDGEQMSFNELKYLVERILNNISIPLSVDIEAGYSREISQILTNIRTLSELGVVGINIEDSLIHNKRSLQSIEEFTRIIRKITSYLGEHQIDMFLNVRTDTYLLGIKDALLETIQRIHEYEEAGADGIFIPCLTDIEDIKSVIAITKLPINVMCMPDLPSFEILSNLGIKRISMGNFLHNSVITDFENRTNKIMNDKSFDILF